MNIVRRPTWLSTVLVATLPVACGDGAGARTSSTQTGSGSVSVGTTSEPGTDSVSDGSTEGSGTADATGTATTPTTGPSTGTSADATGPAESSTGGACDPGAEMCVNGQHQVCMDGMWVDDPCPAPQTCMNDTCSGGCAPGETECIDGGSWHQCNDQGDWDPPVMCGDTDVCQLGQCLTACQMAEAIKSNVGCEFWAVDMPNLPPRDNYVYAVAISNPSETHDVGISIYDGNDNGNEQLLINDTIAPRQVKVFNLSGSHNGQNGHYPSDAGFLGTGISLGRAFRIASDLPIVATQFNPIGGATGYTTDASLLLPTHTLGSDYLHLAWDQGYGEGSTLMIVATEDGTDITITPNVNTLAGQNGLPAMTAGVGTQVSIDAYDYVQISTGPNNQDLSGSVITSSAPVAVFGGHTCANIPTTSTTACDHVEEQIFPLETWGNEYVAARNPPRGNEHMLWRIVAAEDGTTVNFDPPVSLGAQTMMNASDVVQFTDPNDFHVSADKPILLAGYMLGCSSTGVGGCPGDPYMVLMVPVEQYQDDYVFLVDTSYDQDFAKLIRPTDADIDVDCLGVVPDDRWTQVGTSNWEVATIDMNPGEAQCAPGTNQATGTSPFGILVSGQSSAASYAYAGGLALQPINPQ